MGLLLLQSAKVSDPVRLFSLLSLGEIGRHMYVQNVVLVFVAPYSWFQSSWQLLYFVIENLLKTSCFLLPSSNSLFLSDFLITWHQWQCHCLRCVLVEIKQRFAFRSQTVNLYEAIYSKLSPSALSHRKQTEIKSLFLAVTLAVTRIWLRPF